MGFTGGSNGKESACSSGDLGSIRGSGRSPGRREWQPTPVFLPGEFQGQGSLAGYSPRVIKSWTRLSNFPFHFCFTILCWFLPYINMNQLQVCVCPPRSQLPPYPTPPCGQRSLDLSSLRHTENFHWLSNFTYGNVYVSVLLSQFIPPFSSPSVSRSLFSMSASLLLPST